MKHIAAKYQSRRDVLVKGLHEAGLKVEIPKASMFVWAQIPEPYRAQRFLKFAKQLISEAKISVSSGIGFGDCGEGHLCFALIENENRVCQAIRGIKVMLRR
jgi:alanine-synthesizing transaminase